MDYSTQSLLVFIASQTLNVGGLIIDFFLIKQKYPTVTEICVRYPIVGATVIIFETLFPISLGLHFYFSRNNYNFPIEERQEDISL